MRKQGILCTAAMVASLSAHATVGGTERGRLIGAPQLVLSWDAATFESQLNASSSGQQILAVAGVPSCGVNVYHIEYGTIGGAGEPATASAAVMVPNGSGAHCSGARPTVLYAHGTAIEKDYNIADIANPNNTASAEGLLVAAVFAAQGYLVVAPNYAGYDDSSLPYHPFVNEKQQSSDMIDALDAAHRALWQKGVPALRGTTNELATDGGKLFVSGYSQGGYVAMATSKALQAAGRIVTASAPMSGPYALEAFGDSMMFGDVDLGSTIFTPLIIRSYQVAYRDIYQQPTDIYEPTYAATAPDALPSTLSETTIFADNVLPETALFDSTTPVTGNSALNAILAVPSNPLFALGFGASNLMTNDYRLSYVLDALNSPDGAVPTATPGVPLATAPQQPLRKAFRLNDLRSWTPATPILLCGGSGDPTVFFSVNTGTMQAYWSSLPAGRLTVLDVQSAVTGASDPFAQQKEGFQQAEASIAASGGESAVEESYHLTVEPFCSSAAREFFSRF